MELELQRWDSLGGDSLATRETNSSTETAWGPGSLSGRAIKSLGEASLRGVEALIIRWRLAKISSNLPQNQKSASPVALDKMEKLYDDLLELSRMEYYEPKVRLKALRMIMMQIGSRETAQLVGCITKWPRTEMAIFLSDMMPCIKLLWQPSNTPKPHLDLITVYCSSQSTEAHQVLPFVDFIGQLARVNHTACRAVLEAKFLDLLEEIYNHCDAETHPEVVSVCKAILQTFLDDPHGLHVVLQFHRMDLIWPRGIATIPLSRNSLLLADSTPRARKKVLQSYNQDSLWDRLCEIQVILSLPQYYAENSRTEKDLFDVAFDLLQLYLHQDDSYIVGEARQYLLQCLAIGGEWWIALRSVLILLSYDENLDFFYHIIYPLLRLKTEVLPTAAGFYRYVKDYHPDVNPAEYFVDFAIDVAERSQESARAIKDADIVSLLGSLKGTTESVANLVARFHQTWYINERDVCEVGGPIQVQIHDKPNW